MKRVPFFLLTLLATGLIVALTGCSKDETVTPAPTPTDEQAMQQQITSVDSLADFSSSDELTIDDGGLQNPEYDGVAAMITTYGGPSKIGVDSIYPVRWGRWIRWGNVSYDFHVTKQGDTAATVLVKKTLPCEFWVGWGTKNSDTTIVDTVVKKPFTEDVRRVVHFRRIARTANPFRNWVPVAITMVQGQADSASKFAVASLEVSEDRIPFDTTFTDPLTSWFRLGLWPLRGSVPLFPSRDSLHIKLTITSSDSLAEIAVLRYGIGSGRPERRRVLMPLESTTGGPGDYTRVYERTFVTDLPPVLSILAMRFNLVADVISRGSVYDMAVPFTNEFWGMPYVAVRPVR
jgi:hypothetical protein